MHKMDSPASKAMILSVILLLFAWAVFADDTTTAAPVLTDNVTTSIRQPDITASTEAPSSTSESATTQSTEASTTTGEATTDVPMPVATESYNVTSVFPAKVNLGQAQLNIQVVNDGNTPLKNLVAIISGDGYSSYNIVPIDSLAPGQKSYIIAGSRFETAGNITLTILIRDRTFSWVVAVIDPNKKEGSNAGQDIIDQGVLANLSATLDGLNRNYTALQNDYLDKKSQNYDVSEISFTDLKEYLRQAQKSIVEKDVEGSKANIVLAGNELSDVRNRLAHAQIIKKSWTDLLKENALLISTLAGAVVAFFSLMELLKKKQEGLYHKIKEIKAGKAEDTKDGNGEAKSAKENAKDKEGAKGRQKAEKEEK